MKISKFILPMIFYISLYTYAEFQKIEISIGIVFVNLMIYFIYLSSLLHYSKKGKIKYEGFLISLFSFILGNIIIGIVIFGVYGRYEQIPTSVMYINSYNSEHYFQNLDKESELSLGIYKQVNDELVLYYELEEGEYYTSIIDGNFLIQSFFHSDYSGTTYYLVDIETKVSSLIPLFNEYIRPVCITDTNIIFYTSSPKVFFIYDILTNSIIYEYIHEGSIRYYLDTIFYSNNKLYMNNRSDVKTLAIYDFETETLMEVENTTLTDIFNISDFYVESIDSEVYIYSVMNTVSNEKIITKIDDNYIVLNQHEVPNGYNIDIYEDKIILYFNDFAQGIINIDIYDFDFNIINSIEIEETCDRISIINEETIQCSNYKERGAILFRKYKKIELFSLITGESIYDSGWIKIQETIEYTDF